MDPDEIVGGGLETRKAHIFLVCDTSGSMAGQPIGQLNAAVDNAIPALRAAEDDDARGEIVISVLQFSTGASWVERGPLSVHDYKHHDLSADGVTDAGAAFHLLADALDESAMPANAFAPVVALISDGVFTDDWRSGLKKLQRQRWFRAAYKAAISVAIASGQGADIASLEAFVEDPKIDRREQEVIFTAHDANQLAELIRWATVNLSQQSMGSYSDAEGNEIAAPGPALGDEPVEDESEDDDEEW